LGYFLSRIHVFSLICVGKERRRKLRRHLTFLQDNSVLEVAVKEFRHAAIAWIVGKKKWN